MSMKTIGHFLESYNLVCLKNFFRLYINKSFKAICNLIFPKCMIVLGKWVAGRVDFILYKFYQAFLYCV